MLFDRDIKDFPRKVNTSPVIAIDQLSSYVSTNGRTIQGIDANECRVVWIKVLSLDYRVLVVYNKLCSGT